jgi:wobble nucleotide-excising tRNase
MSEWREWITVVASFAAVLIALKGGRLKEAEFIQAAYKDFGQELERKLDALEKKYKGAKARIEFLELALTNAHKKIDRLITIIKDLVKQLVDEGIEPVHTLEDLEKE